MSTLTIAEVRDFRGYLKNCTDEQVFGVWEKEYLADRYQEAELATAEAEARGLDYRDRRIAVMRAKKGRSMST